MLNFPIRIMAIFLFLRSSLIAFMSFLFLSIIVLHIFCLIIPKDFVKFFIVIADKIFLFCNIFCLIIPGKEEYC